MVSGYLLRRRRTLAEVQEKKAQAAAQAADGKRDQSTAIGRPDRQGSTDGQWAESA